MQCIQCMLCASEIIRSSVDDTKQPIFVHVFLKNPREPTDYLAI